VEHLNPNQFKETKPRYSVQETDGGHSVWDREGEKFIGTLGLKQPRKPTGIPDRTQVPGEYAKFRQNLHDKVIELNEKNVGSARNFKG